LVGGGRFAPTGDRAITNITGDFIGIRDSQEYRPVPPDGKLVVEAPGTLVIRGIVWFGESSKGGSSSDGIEQTDIPPDLERYFHR